MARLRHPAVADTTLTGLASAALDARDRVQDMGFRAPNRSALANGMRPEEYPDEQDFGPSCLGWQRDASKEANKQFLPEHRSVSNDSRALVRSQGGPLAGLPFSCCHHVLPHAPRCSSVLSTSSASPLAPPSSHSAYLPVWPSPRQPWPHRAACAPQWEFWVAGVRLGVSSSPCVA